MSIVLNKEEKRDMVLYVRIKAQNKDWVQRKTLELGYPSESKLVDAILDQARKDATRAKKSR